MIATNMMRPLTVATAAFVAILAIAGCAGGTNDADKAPVGSASASNGVLAAAYKMNDAQVPTIGVDPRNGAAYVAYYYAPTSDVYLTRRPSPDSPWGEPVRVNSKAGEVKPHSQAPAQVAVGPDGVLYVVWSNAIPVEGRRFDASNLFIARSTDGGRTFSEQNAINTDADEKPAGHTFHDVKVAGDGTVFVSWLDSRDEPTPGHAHGADATDDHMHGASTVRVAGSRDFGRSFGEATVVARDVCPCCRTSLAIAQDGTVYVAWRGIDRSDPSSGEQRDIMFARSSDGALTFTEPRRIHNDAWQFNGCPHAGPSLAVDSDGDLHAAWFTGADGRSGLYYAVAGADGEFGPPTALITGVGVSQVRLASDGGSGVWVAFEDQTDRSIRVSHIGADGEMVGAGVKEGATLPSLAAVDGGYLLASQGPDPQVIAVAGASR